MVQRIDSFGLRGMIGAERVSAIADTKPRRSSNLATPATLASSKGADTLETRAAKTRTRLEGLEVRVFVATSRDAVGDDAAEGTYVFPGGEINVGRKACSVSVRTRRAERLAASADANGNVLDPGPGTSRARRSKSSELSADQRRQVVDAVKALGPKWAAAARAAKTWAEVRIISDALDHAVRLREASEMGKQSARAIAIQAKVDAGHRAYRRGDRRAAQEAWRDIDPGYRAYLRECGEAGVWLG